MADYRAHPSEIALWLTIIGGAELGLYVYDAPGWLIIPTICLVWICKSLDEINHKLEPAWNPPIPRGSDEWMLRGGDPVDGDSISNHEVDKK
jgi:hypothetical protein